MKISTLIASTCTLLMFGLSNSALAQEPDGDPQIDTRAHTLTINPLGFVFPELRIGYEMPLSNPTSSLLLAASAGSRYAFWDTPQFFYVYDRPRIARLHAQLRKYFTGDFRGGIYLAGELMGTGRIDSGFGPSATNEFAPFTAYTVGGALIAFGGIKHVTRSGLTLDLGLGLGSQFANTLPPLSFLICPRFDMGWTF